jgi:hypothetical protein
MRVSDAFSGFLEAEDIPDGKEIEVEIECVRMGTRKDLGRDGRPIENPIMKIKGVKKEMVLNKTNARTIRRHHGNEMDEWSGKKITLFRSTCDAFGKKNVPCIRVKGKTL